MKVLNLGVYMLNRLKTDFCFETGICFAEQILDAMMKCAAVEFLCILGYQYMIGSVFSFSSILKPKRLVYSVFSSIISSQLSLTLQ